MSFSLFNSPRYYNTHFPSACVCVRSLDSQNKTTQTGIDTSLLSSALRSFDLIPVPVITTSCKRSLSDFSQQVCDLDLDPIPEEPSTKEVSTQVSNPEICRAFCNSGWVQNLLFEGLAHTCQASEISIGLLSIFSPQGSDNTDTTATETTPETVIASSSAQAGELTDVGDLTQDELISLYIRTPKKLKHQKPTSSPKWEDKD